MYVVAGSTGQVGGAVVRELLAKGKQVRAILRDPAKAADLEALGATTFVSSVEEASSIEKAFEEVEGAFIMTPPLLDAPDPRVEHRMMLAVVEHALQASHVPKVVFLSSIGAEQEEGTGAILKLHDLEEAIFALPLPAAASIRAAYFMENLKPLVGHAKETGTLPCVIEPLDHTIAMIATADIGKLAAELLTSAWEGKRIVELEGPRQYSMLDAASTLQAIVGRAVKPVIVPAGERKALFESLGAVAGGADAMVEMTDGFNSGLIAFHGADGAEHVQGTTSLEQVLGAQ